jgi:DnaJ family protein A protein 5
MFRKFNGNVDFSDAPSGFFGFLRETFEQLAKEEESASYREGVDIPDYPAFGHRDDDHDTIKSFYNVWTAFSTRKTFAWRDRYRVSEAEDRWMRRQMEKENKQFRVDAKQEFNDAVRSLVAFVKKRDPRYILNVQSEEERQKTLREAAQAQAARMRAANQAKLDEYVPEWTKTREPDEFDEVTSDESEEEQFECVACRKVFKSENQFDAHERSKKHQKAVYALRKILKKEGIELDLDTNDDPDSRLQTSKYDMSKMDDTKASEDDTSPHDMHIQDDDQGTAHAAEEDIVSQAAAVSLVESRDSVSNKQEDEGSSDEVSEDADDENQVEETLRNIVGDTEEVPGGRTPIADKKMGKAAQKRAKRAAQQEAASQDGNQHVCAGCSASFPSKKRMFDHLKDHPRHVTLKGTGGGSERKGKRI